MDVVLATITSLHADPPKLTVAPSINPVPVIVTAVRPFKLPLVGKTLVTVGSVK
jgi:hypothetical protein